MEEFVNYYEEFSIPTNASLDEIRKILISERKKWNLRQNTADLDKRQGAERKLLLLDEATDAFQDDYSRKVYDRKLSANGGGGQTQARPQVNTGAAKNADEIILRIKNVYEAGNSNAVIDLCNTALNQGYRNFEIYDYLCAAYEESQKYDLALANAKTALYVTNNNWFKYLIAKYDVYYFNNINEAKQLIDELKNDHIDAAVAMALGVEIELRLGNEEEAQRQVNAYLNTHPNDEAYKQQVASAYLRYSDVFLTTANDGYLYWNRAEDYNNSVRYRKMAFDLCPNSKTKEIYERALSFNEKVFDKEDLVGPIFMGLLGLWMLSAGGVFFGLILLGLFIWIMTTKNATKWQNDRDVHAGSRPLPKQIARISTNIAKFIGLFILELLKQPW